MSLITNNIKAILAIKIKPRHDGYTDQFSRIFMVKMFIIASLVMGVDWFHDTVACMVPKDTALSGSFVHSACWIQGFYIFPVMATRLEDSNYYGIPKEAHLDGFDEKGEYCRSRNEANMPIEGCRPMEKQYYLQYQWMPFYSASLSLLFYMPYVVFRIINTDMVSLRDTMTRDKVEVDSLTRNYFNEDVNSRTKLRIRIIANVFVKLLYVGANVGAFYFTDDLLYGNFRDYGKKWGQWMRMNHTSSFDFFEGKVPKPGNVLLPSFGFCDIREGSMDMRSTFFNRNRFICEISPNILYQYTFIVLWFCMIISIAVSIVGVLLNLLNHLCNLIGFFETGGSSSQQVYKSLTLRECEYLTFIRRKNIPVYGEVIRRLVRSRGNVPNGTVEITPLMNGNHKSLNNGNLRESSIKHGTAPPEETHWTKL